MTYGEIFQLYINLIPAEDWAERNRRNPNGIFRDPEKTWVDIRAKIGRGTLIFPGCVIMGKTILGKRCVLFPHTTVLNIKAGDNVVIGLPIKKNSSVGSGSVLGETAEVNRAKLGRKVKMVHHGYLGDTRVDNGVNIGAGTITANFGGGKKKKTVIGKNAFIGINASLVAPLRIGNGAFIGAGAVVTKHVPKSAVVVGVNRVLAGRTSQKTAEGWKIVQRQNKPKAGS